MSNTVMNREVMIMYDLDRLLALFITLMAVVCCVSSYCGHLRMFSLIKSIGLSEFR